MDRVQATVTEPPKDILECHVLQRLTDSPVQALRRPLGELVELPLELRPQLLERVVVRAIRRIGRERSRPI